MGQAQLSVDHNNAEDRAQSRYGMRGVPGDWFVDPADPNAAKSFQDASREALEDAATAFLEAHEEESEDLAEAGTGLLEDFDVDDNPQGPTVSSSVTAVWIGLRPGLDDFSDEGELGWQSDALCAQTDPEAFFPEKGGSTRDAKKVCGACNVKSQCLEYALANDERFGIWGGLSERERRRLRKRAV